MNFEQWLAANGYDAEELKKPERAKERKHLEAAWKAETNPPPVAKVVEETVAKNETVDDKLALYEAEAERAEAITDMAEKWCAENQQRNPEKIQQLRALREAAIEDKKTTVKDFQLTLLRFDRTVGPMILTPRSEPVTSDVLEAAVCVAGGLENIEKQFSAQTLEMAHKKYKGGIGLHAMIGDCASATGWLPSAIRSISGKPRMCC